MRNRHPASLPILLAFCVLVLGATAAGATTVSYVAGVPLQTTNWSTTLTFPQFNPALGLLTGVTVEVRDSLVHQLQYENISPTSQSRYRDSTYVTIDVMRPASTSLVTAVSKIYRTGLVTAYDNTLDYGGTSGVTLDGIVDYTTWSSTTNAPADLVLFTGTGTIDLPCQAVAYFVLSYSGGNGRWALTTRAQAYVIVTYTYDSAVGTTPTSWGRIKTLYR